MKTLKNMNTLLSALVIVTMLLGGVDPLQVHAQDVTTSESTYRDIPTVKDTLTVAPIKVSSVEATPTSVPTVQPTAEPPTSSAANAAPGGDNSHGHVTPAERQAAAARAAAARQAGLRSAEQMAAAAAPLMNPGGVPDYFGAIPNYANSPLPASLGISGDGTGANGTVTLTAGGVVSSIAVTNGGSDYSDAATTAMVIGGGGSGAILMPVIDPISGSITSINVVNGGTGYNTVPGIRKFVDSLPGLGYSNRNNLGQYIPVAIPDTITYPGSDYYEIELGQYTEQLHSDLPATLLRGYRQTNTSDSTVSVFSYLGPVIIAQSGRPVRIKFTNNLPTGSGGDLFIPVDTTVMGAGMGPSGEVTGITITSGGSGYTSAPLVTISGDGTGATAEATILNGAVNVIHITNPGTGYTTASVSMTGTATASATVIGTVAGNYSQNRATLHLHGGNTPWISDGTPDQWTTPATETTSYPEGVSVYNVPDMPDPGPGSLTFFYTNQQSARLMFYHDHAYGITRLNVYAGEAAGYLVTDPVEQTLINGGTIGSVTVPAGTIPATEIPLIIQDKTFVPSLSQLALEDPTWNSGSTPGTVHTGDLWFPHVYMPNQNPFDPMGVNGVGRWDYGPWFWPPFNTITYGEVPNPLYPSVTNPLEGPNNPGTPNPSIVPEGYMDTPLVNGTPYPFLSVNRQAYRFRILNASNDRMLDLQLYCAKSNGTMWDITGALLDANAGEVNMVPAVETSGYPANWPTDGRAGGVPDPAAIGPSFIQIGTEGGLLPAPAVIPNQPVGYLYDRRNIVVLNVSTHALMLGPAERADVIVDFSQVPSTCTNIIMYNDSPAPVPAFDPRNDYYTGGPDNTGIGGAPSTLPGYGPNTRTIMQIRVSGSASAPYNLGVLQTALPAAFAASQPVPLVPQAAYDAAYGANYPTDAYARIQDMSLAFTPAGITSINTIRVTAGGSGYIAAPLVSFSGSSTTSAIATANVDGNGTVTSITINSGGTGYASPPTVNITGGSGNGAKATATVAGGIVTSITVTNGGFGYAPKVTLVDGTGSGATATATVANLPGSGATATATITSGIVDNTIIISNGGSGYTSAPIVVFTGGGSPTTVATATATINGSGVVTAITVTNGGAGYTSPPIVNIVNGVVTAITVTNGGSGYTSIGVPSVVISGGGPGGSAPKTPAVATASTAVTEQLQPKAIQELFTLDYGRMNATLGVEIPSTNGTNQTTIPYGYIDPATELVMSTTDALTPIGALADGTQLWKITHNGVDTHAIHFHMFNVQLINRVGWDGMIRPPDPNEVGWKETIRMNPLEDAIIALRPIVPIIPFTIGNSTRPLDVTMPIGSNTGFWGQDPLGNIVTILNQMVNYGWEYVWHCHLLGHEENDMMRPMIIAVPPDAPTLLASATSTPPFTFTWNDNSTNATSFSLQRATDPAFTMNLKSFTVAKVPGMLQTYTDTTAIASTLYYYRVLANNVVGGIVGTPTEPSMTAASTPSNIVILRSPSNLYYLTLVSPHGSVVKAPDQPAYNSSTSIVLTATADAGWTFTGWSGGGCSGTGTCTLTLSADTIVTANYSPISAITISGVITIAGGVTPLAGVTLSYIDGTPKTTNSAVDGTYAFSVSAGWTGTVIPTLTGYTFSPVSRNYTTPAAINLTLQNYAATVNPITISGTVTLAGGSVGLAGVTISYTGLTISDVSGAVNTNSSGIYSFTVPFGWSGTVTPVKAGYTFSPVNISYSTVTTNQLLKNYTATPITFTISGNAGVPGAILNYFDGAQKTATADSTGAYSLSVSYFWSGNVSPSLFGYTFLPFLRTYTHVIANQTGQNYTATLNTGWYGGTMISSDRSIVVMGRPQIGNQVMAYDGFTSGSTTMFLPMLFKNIWGYDSAFYVQNIDPINTANITMYFYDTTGTLSCTQTDSIPLLSSHGYWLPSITCLGTSWVGSVKVTSDRNIVAVGRPHIGSEITTYNGFADGSLTMYLPMLFKNIWGYDSALYIQNVDPATTANITMMFYDTSGNLSCMQTGSIPRLSSIGYWLPSVSCLPSSWAGSVEVTSDRDIVAVGRPHLGTAVTTYDGFAGGSTNFDVPSLFKNTLTISDGSALYVQNINSVGTASITLNFYDTNGALSCTQTDSIPSLSSHGYWLPSLSCLPNSWQGSVRVVSSLPVVAVGRQHIGGEVAAFDGFTGGSDLFYVPMLFKNMWSIYNSTLTMQNMDLSNTAFISIDFYDVNGNLSCVRTDSIPAMATLSYWLPDLSCLP